MSYKNDDDSIWDEDTAAEQTLLDNVADLLEKHEARYREQVRALLRDREFRQTHGKTLLVYSLENRGCSIRTSTDGGFDFRLSSWISLNGRKVDKYKTLEFQFAQIEAHLDSQS